MFLAPSLVAGVTQVWRSDKSVNHTGSPLQPVCSRYFGLGKAKSYEANPRLARPLVTGGGYSRLRLVSVALPFVKRLLVAAMLWLW